MSRLYDRVRRSGAGCATDHDTSQGWWRNGGWGPGGIDVIEDAVVVQIGNAANHWFAYKPGIQSLATLAPPFPCAFYECKRPTFVEETKGLAEWGFLAVARDMSDDEQKAQYLSWCMTPDGDVETLLNHPDLRWVVEYALFASDPRSGGLGGPSIVMTTFLNEDGVEVGLGTHRKGAWYTTMIPGANTHERRQEYYEFCLALLAPVYFAISLMHCQNVVLEANDPPEKPSKKHHRRYGVPLTRYYTLAIESPAVAPSSSRAIAATNPALEAPSRAMHITRGHFRHYTPPVGPFGRVISEPQTVWVNQHVRGNAGYGEVIKDYEVKA